MIAAFIAAKKYPPTLREIGKALGIRSTNGVNDHLLALQKKGWIARIAVESRAIILQGPEAAPLPALDDSIPGRWPRRLVTQRGAVLAQIWAVPT